MQPPRPNVFGKSAFESAMEYSRAGDHVSAERICRQIVQNNPAEARAWCHIGTVCLIQNRLDEALKAYEQAVRVQPQFPEALNNIAATYTKMGKTGQAIEAFTRAVTQRPDWAEPLINLGNMFMSAEQYDRATENYLKAVKSDPKNPEPHCLLGTAMGRQGFLQQAAQHFIEAIRLNPRYETPHSNLLLVLNHDHRIRSQELLFEHRWFDRLHGQGLVPAAGHANSRDPQRPLRVGYVSPDFRKHPVANFALPIFESHDPQNLKVFAYSQLAQEDEVTARLRKCTSGWYSTYGKTDAQMCQQIRDDQIDILVDLAGHTGGNRLMAMARRPAPVQATYLGYPSTTGMAAIQYRLTDFIADPQGEESFYTEELVHLPGCFCCYEPPDNAPDVAPAPSRQRGYITFGLLHKLPKFNDPMFDLWSKVLGAVPDSRLLIFRNTVSQRPKDWIIDGFSRHGIDASRLDIRGGSAKDSAHLAVYNEIDISLDSLPWSGHATTCESLWMGVPMVTLRGDRHAGRMSASILGAVNLKELIAESSRQFVQIAAALAGDSVRLASLRSELRSRMKASPLCDAPSFVRSLESVYRSLWRRWCESSTGKGT